MTSQFQTILLTGGTGSFGQAMTQFLLEHTSATIRIFSRDEVKQGVMAARCDYDPRLRFFLGDVRSQERLEEAMDGVDFVIHAAALKQVPSGEYNIGELLRTNILGTENVTKAARRCNVGKVVFLSTDKAVLSCNSYGFSKGMAERIVIQANGYAPYGTEYCCVRYGNVHGSRGSVVELWREALREGEPLRVTDLRMTRFFLTIDEAVRVAWAAAHIAPRGGILIPYLPAYTLEDLCGAMRRVYGQGSVDIKTIGVRIGEKLHEDLASPDEGGRLAIYTIDGTTPRYYCVMPMVPTWDIAPIKMWPVWDGAQHGRWYKGSLDIPYNSGTWPWRLDCVALERKIRDACESSK